MLIKDRQTGVSCRCTVGSYHMFGGIWYSGEYDVRRVPIRPNDVVLDIGANQGFFACYAASQGAQVYAFEPNPSSYELLLENIKQNKFQDRVTARPWAISDKNATVELWVSKEQGGGMSSINPAFARNAKIHVRQTLNVESFTLAQVFEFFNLSDVRLCKVDAEGSEIQILSSLSAKLVTRIDSFAMEVHPEAYSRSELVEVVNRWGTHTVGFNDQKLYSALILHAVSHRCS